GEAEYEACAPKTVGPSARVERAAVRLDDRARDREAEPAVVAERLGIGAHGMEALEHLLARILGNPRSLVADGHLHAIVVAVGDADLDHAAWGRERYRIVEQVLDHPFEPQRHAHHLRAAH